MPELVPDADALAGSAVARDDEWVLGGTMLSSAGAKLSASERSIDSYVCSARRRGGVLPTSGGGGIAPFPV